MDRPEPGVPGGDAVAPLGFERGEEPRDALDCKVRNVHTVHRASHFSRREAQEQQ
jgi:hypothetical protein